MKAKQGRCASVEDAGASRDQRTVTISLSNHALSHVCVTSGVWLGRVRCCPQPPGRQCDSNWLFYSRKWLCLKTFNYASYVWHPTSTVKKPELVPFLNRTQLFTKSLGCCAGGGFKKCKRNQVAYKKRNFCLLPSSSEL